MQCSNTAGRRGENSCRKGEKLLLEQEASSRDAENIVWHACYLGGRKSSISYKTAPPPPCLDSHTLIKRVHTRFTPAKRDRKRKKKVKKKVKERGKKITEGQTRAGWDCQWSGPEPMWW